MRKIEKIIVVLSFALVLSVASMVVALTSWTRSFSGTISSYSFDVQYPLGTSIPNGLTIQLGTVDNGMVSSYSYYIVNTGNVPITVGVGSEILVNCIAIWNPATDAIIPVGGNVLFQLALTVNGTAGEPISYSFNFD